MKQILFFFPHNPYPPITGAHRRCLELLWGLKELGHRIIFISSTFTSDQPWSKKAIAALSEKFNSEIHLHKPSFIESKSSRLLVYLKKGIISEKNNLDFTLSLFMKSWCTKVTRQVQADILFMNYAYFDKLFPKELCQFNSRIMEMHDLVTLNNKMQKAISEVVNPSQMAVGDIPEEMLDPKFFLNKGLSAEPIEFEVYNRYDYTLCISKEEKELVESYAPDTKAVFLPMTYSVSYLDNVYDQAALFCVGPNPFNIQGYYYFLYKILPLVKTRTKNFKLQVTGKFFYNLVPRTEESIIYRGFVKNLDDIYRKSSFFICPVFGGTGQQVKIVEAMANGLPVIALKNAAKHSPIEHGVNGMIALDEHEFAEYAIRLWNDRNLCKRLGKNALETIAARYSKEKLLSGLSEVI